jgi:PGF-CTERM protein
MKSKRTLVLFMLFVSISFVMLLGPVCNAQHAVVSIKDVTVQLLKIRPPVGGTTIREYKISAIIQNTGNIPSDNITVKFREPQPGISGNLTMQPGSYSLQPHEETTFVFENWPTTLTGDIPLNISFEPSSPNVLLTSDNSGFYLYTLHIENNTTPTTPSTPGFEVLIVLVALLALLGLKQKKK